MTIARDITGHIFGTLTALRFHHIHPGKSGAHIWLCRCSCSTELTVWKSALLSGNTRSCGISPCLPLDRRFTNGKVRRVQRYAFLKQIPTGRWTPKQLLIVEKMILGWTQQEIAEELGVVQSTIFKAINGNEQKSKGKIYGGILRKARKANKTNGK